MSNNYSENPNIPSEYTPISMWGYFGYQILFSIPVVGFIVLIVFALGASNVNLKNFARSYFCVLILGLIIMLILALTGAGAYFASYLSNNMM